MQGRDIVRMEGVVGSGDLMAAWLASGGAIEASSGIHTRGRQDAATADDGMQAARPTWPCAQDGLRAVMNTALASCGVPDGGVQAFGLTTGRHAC